MSDERTNSQTWRNMLSVGDMCRVTDVPSKSSAAIQPQYAHAPVLSGLCGLMQSEMDATPQLEEMFSAVANPATAKGVFLDWLGERVGVSRSFVMDGATTTLDDDDFRFLVFLKAMANIGAENVAEINRLLSMLLDAPVFTIDLQNMTIVVQILGPIKPTPLAILKTLGVPNRPTGVLARIRVIDVTANYFGFAGSDFAPFDDGILFDKEEF